MDMGGTMAEWMPAAVSDCSKYNNNCYIMFNYLKNILGKIIRILQFFLEKIFTILLVLNLKKWNLSVQ